MKRCDGCIVENVGSLLLCCLIFIVLLNLSLPYWIHPFFISPPFFKHSDQSFALAVWKPCRGSLRAAALQLKHRAQFQQRPSFLPKSKSDWEAKLRREVEKETSTFKSSRKQRDGGLSRTAQRPPVTQQLLRSRWDDVRGRAERGRKPGLTLISTIFTFSSDNMESGQWESPTY